MVGRPAERNAQLLATAYHEAGHAIAGDALGLTVMEVSVAAGQGSLGRCCFLETPDTDEFLEKRQIAKLAGAEAQRHIMPGYDGVGASSDMLSAVDGQARRYGIADLHVAEAQMAEWSERARALVQANLEVIHVLARVLVERGTLGGEQFHMALNEARARVAEDRRLLGLD